MLVHSHIQMFADDTKLYCKVNNMQTAHALPKDLTALESWTATSQLNFNAEKCKVMPLGYNQLQIYIPHDEGSSTQSFGDLLRLISKRLS